MRDLKNELGEQLVINWRSFLLEQVNTKDKGDNWKAWEQPPDYISRGIWPLRGGIASNKINTKFRDIFSMKLMERKHVKRDDVRSRKYIIDLAVECGMDQTEFSKILDSDETMDSIINDHKFAESKGIFGTPTFFSETLGVLFVKMFTPPKEEALEVFMNLIGISDNKKYLGEIKRPQPPWPRGATD